MDHPVYKLQSALNDNLNFFPTHLKKLIKIEFTNLGIYLWKIYGLIIIEKVFFQSLTQAWLKKDCTF